MKDLPLDLRRPLSTYIYKDLRSQVNFLKNNKSEAFLAWFCPLLKLRVAGPSESIYYENDKLQSIYFVQRGSCNYVLPKYGNRPFIQIVDNTYFGLSDFITSLLALPGDLF